MTGFGSQGVHTYGGARVWFPDAAELVAPDL